jgi:hypothetical protein
MPIKKDRQQQGHNRPGRHQQTKPEQTYSHGDWSRDEQPPRPFVGERRDGDRGSGPSTTRDRKFADSPLEGAGFEPSVPLPALG